MVQRPGNRSSICFCSAECPPGSRPFKKYQIIVDDDDWPDFKRQRLYDFHSKFEDECFWEQAEPVPPFGSTLTKRPFEDEFFDHAYTWILSLFVGGPGPSDIFFRDEVWNDTTDPITPYLPPGCDSEFLLTKVEIPFTFAFVTPIPDWICNEAQLEEWNPGTPEQTRARSQAIMRKTRERAISRLSQGPLERLSPSQVQ